MRRVTNPDQWDYLFRQVMALRMAKRFAMGLANSSTYFQLIDAEMKDALRAARSTNSMETFPDPFPEGSWTTSRWGGHDSRFSWANR